MIVYTPPDSPLKAPIAIVEQLDATSSSVQAMIYALWGQTDGEKMVRVLTCESGLSENNASGTMLVSSTNDVGIGQIHLGSSTPWLSIANNLGYNLTDTAQNLLMARYIWEVQGFEAWVCSKKLGIT